VNLFLLNLLLALMFCLMFGTFDVYVIAAGFLAGFVLLASVTRALTGRTYGGYLLRLGRFAGYFFRILITANWQVAKEVLSPGQGITPRLIRYDVSGLSDLQVTTLANSISLTPGTLAVDLSPGSREKRWLYVHCMFADDRAKTVADIDELKRRLLTEVFE
jgi:multicomponent Na+:H+ antiporter subunit E